MVQTKPHSTEVYICCKHDMNLFCGHFVASSSLNVFTDSLSVLQYMYIILGVPILQYLLINDLKDVEGVMCWY